MSVRCKDVEARRASQGWSRVTEKILKSWEDLEVPTLHDELAGPLDLSQHIGAAFSAPVGWRARVTVGILIVPVDQDLGRPARVSGGDGPHSAAPRLVPALV